MLKFVPMKGSLACPTDHSSAFWRSAVVEVVVWASVQRWFIPVA